MKMMVMMVMKMMVMMIVIRSTLMVIVAVMLAHRCTMFLWCMYCTPSAIFNTTSRA